MMMKVGLLLVVLLGLTGISNAEKPRWYQQPRLWFKSVWSAPDKNTRAPRLTAIDKAGQAYSVKETREDFLLISFWASWCPPCREELPVLAEYAGQHPRVKVIAVNVLDDSVAARKFVTETGLKLTFLFDVADQTSNAYAISSLPVNYLVEGRTLRILDKWVGTVDFKRLDARLTTQNPEVNDRN